VNLSHILTWGGSGTGAKWVIQIDLIGRLQVDVGGGTVTSSTSVYNDQWRHIAVVLEDDGSPNLNEILLYIDGQPVTTYDSDVAINTVADEPVSIGVYAPNPKYFNGLIDDVRIYNRALNETEIQSLAQ
jgi:hypothetical protein